MIDVKSSTTGQQLLHYYIFPICKESRRGEGGCLSTRVLYKGSVYETILYFLASILVCTSYCYTERNALASFLPACAVFSCSCFLSRSKLFGLKELKGFETQTHDFIISRQVTYFEDFKESEIWDLSWANRRLWDRRNFPHF